MPVALILSFALFAFAMTSSAMAASPAELRGRAFAQTNCARCHSIDRYTPSPLAIAPPFRTLHKKYPLDTLSEAFAEGIDTGHPTMPVFTLEPDQINDLLSFLKSLKQLGTAISPDRS